MTLSIPTILTIETSNIVDHTPEFDNTVHMKYLPGKSNRLKNKGFIYQLNTDSEYYPVIWNAADEANYKLRQVVWKDNKVQVIVNLNSSSTPVQPEDYSTGTGPTPGADPLDSSLWQHRYIAIPRNRSDGGYEISSTDGHVRHKLFKDSASSTGWSYIVSWDYQDEVVSGDIYDPASDYILVKPASYTEYYRKKIQVAAQNGNENPGYLVTDTTGNGNFASGFWIPALNDRKYGATSNQWVDGKSWTGGWDDNQTQYNIGGGDMGIIRKGFVWVEKRPDLAPNATSRIYSYELHYDAKRTIINNPQVWIKKGGQLIAGSSSLSSISVGQRIYFNGVQYEVGSYETTVDGEKRYAYKKITQEGSAGDSGVIRDRVQVYGALTEGVGEVEASVIGQDPKRWVAGTVVSRPDGNIYVRSMGNYPKEVNTTNTPTYEVVEDLLTDFDEFSQVEAAGEGKLTDGKEYSYIEMAGPVSMTLKVDNKFDTLALGGLIGDTMDVKFFNSNGNIVGEVTGFKIDNRRDIDDRLPEYKTTSIVYAPLDIDGGKVEVLIHGDIVHIGTVMVGLSVDAGFTNVEFSNEFIDYSPNEKDQWGNVLYVPGYKARVHSGTVDIHIKKYDITNRLMTSIGGSEVILNGSDSKDNTPPDNENVFSSTMLIGRISDYRLSTTSKGSTIDPVATYTFKLTETI